MSKETRIPISAIISLSSTPLSSPLSSETKTLPKTSTEIKTETATESKEDKNEKSEETIEKEKRITRLNRFHSKNPFYFRELQHTLIAKCADSFWLTPCKYACFFCGYYFFNSNSCPVPRPKSYKNGKFEISGIYCTFVCVKSDIMKDKGNACGEELEALTLMLNDVYCYDQPIPTINKLVFKRYGGPLSHKKFLRKWAHMNKIQVRTIPFVDTPIVLESEFKDVELTGPGASSNKDKNKNAKKVKDIKDVKSDIKEIKSDKDSKDIKRDIAEIKDIKEIKSDIKDKKDIKDNGNINKSNSKDSKG